MSDQTYNIEDVRAAINSIRTAWTATPDSVVIRTGKVEVTLRDGLARVEGAGYHVGPTARVCIASAPGKARMLELLRESLGLSAEDEDEGEDEIDALEEAQDCMLSAKMSMCDGDSDQAHTWASMAQAWTCVAEEERLGDTGDDGDVIDASYTVDSAEEAKRLLAESEMALKDGDDAKHFGLLRLAQAWTLIAREE